MDERSQQAWTRELLEVGARLGEPPPDAFDRADLEPMADECVQRDPPRDDVPARLLPRKIDRVEDLGLDERQLISASRPAEGSATVEVSVSGQTPAGHGLDAVDAGKWTLRLGRSEDRGHGADAAIPSVRLFDR